MAVLTVLTTAVVEIWAAVPVGYALGLPPVAIWILTIVGSLTGVVVVTVLGSAVRDRLMRRLHGRPPTEGRLHRLWTRYGVPGWGLVSPGVFAPAMGTAIALALGAPRGRLLAWMSAGVVAWTSALVLAGFVGLDLLHRLS